MRRRILGNKPATKATALIVAAIALGVAGNGCGFVFSEGPPAGYDRKLYFDCGESIAPPVVDSAAAGLFGLTALGIANESGSNALMGSEKTTAVALYSGFAVLAAASAIYGYQASASCRAAKANRRADWVRASAWAR